MNGKKISLENSSYRILPSRLVHTGNVKLNNKSSLNLIYRGPGSSVDIVTGYGLDGQGIESQWEARFFAPVQTGSESTQPPVRGVVNKFPD